MKRVGSRAGSGTVSQRYGSVDSRSVPKCRGYGTLPNREGLLSKLVSWLVVAQQAYQAALCFRYPDITVN
jgi:hypothetical protein